MRRSVIALLPWAACLAYLSTPADAATIITHADALAGNVTPGDAPGYPITISRSGAYELGTNLTVPLDRVGIDIGAPDVTIDFAGYRMHGLGRGGTGILNGFNSLTVKNGLIAGLKSDGIRGFPGDFLILDNMRIVGNGGAGVTTRAHAQIRNSTISVNGIVGISCGHFCLIESNIISQNGAGIALQSGNVLTNVLQDNGGLALNALNIMGAGQNVMINNNGGGPAQVSNTVALYDFNLCRPDPDCKAP